MVIAMTGFQFCCFTTDEQSTLNRRKNIPLQSPDTSTLLVWCQPIAVADGHDDRLYY
jgi:hypothetical protein